MQGLSGLAVFCDAHLVVLDKPAGLLCVPGRGADKQDCLSARVQAEIPDALVVHRLDMATSGLCVMARGTTTQRQLSALFADRKVRKRYVAIVAGHMETTGHDGWNIIDLPIAADWTRRPRRIIDQAAGKPSTTLWRALSYDSQSGTTRVELEPVTGRTHQLRVHLKALGHPILGDTLYGPAHAEAPGARMLLHAAQLHFTHPVTGAQISLVSAPPF